MSDTSIGSQTVHFSTADLPERERIPAWRDYWGQRVFGAEIEPTTPDPFSAHVTVRPLHGVNLLSTHVSPVRLTRSSALTSDGSDSLGLVMSSCRIKAAQGRREFMLEPGNATLIATADPSVVESAASGQFRCLLIERPALLPFVRDPGAAILRMIPADDTVLRLLLGYLRLVVEDDLAIGQTLAGLVASHVRDLIALMLEPKTDRDAIGNGLRAARFAAIKRHVADRCDDPSLTIHDVAGALAATPRYIQRLFASEGTTFTGYLLDRRLARVCDALVGTSRSISDVALSAGFSDISHFNRCFKSRYGMSPREFRSDRRR